jgi:hypothetical protein
MEMLEIWSTWSMNVRSSEFASLDVVALENQRCWERFLVSVTKKQVTIASNNALQLTIG